MRGPPPWFGGRWEVDRTRQADKEQSTRSICGMEALLFTIWR